jgi:hypothetical protein
MSPKRDEYGKETGGASYSPKRNNYTTLFRVHEWPGRSTVAYDPQGSYPSLTRSLD